METLPYGLNVDEIVTANALEEIEVDRLGYSNHHNDLNPQVMFASFSDESFDTYSDYNRVFVKGNTIPLKFPAFGESYPDGSGVGVGTGLKYNTGTLIVQCQLPISAIRVKPPCTLEVSISSNFDDITQFVGATITSGDGTCSELSLSSNVSNFLVLDHVGSLNLYEIEVFTPIVLLPFSTFPVMNNGKTLPYLVSNLGSLNVVRKGGLQNETFTVCTADISKSFGNTRISQKSVHNLSLEQFYLEEASLHEHILRDANSIFPIISAIERNCFNHQKMTQRSLNLINESDSEKMRDLECRIVSEMSTTGVPQLLFNGIAAPQNLEIIADVKYFFQPESIEINGTSVSEVKLSEGNSVIYKKNNVSIGIINAVKKIPTEIYETPNFFMNEYSLEEILNDVSNVSNSLNLLTSTRTPNFGNTISHAAFIDENGKTLNCEECIFLPADVKTISVYCSDTSVPVQILIDGDMKYEIQVSNERLSIVTIELPSEAGVHTLTTNNGSNSLFRISEKSVIHAPMHPSYYTSGQLERDTFSSSSLMIVAQLNNFDLIDDTTMIAKSNSSLISIQDIFFHEDNYSCTNALFCRKKAIDLKNPNILFDHFDSAWDLCSEHPWLACLNVRDGCIVVHAQLSFTNFTFWWNPTTLSDVTIIQGQSCVFITNNKLVIEDSTNRFECDASSIELSKWNHITFTSNSFTVNGITITTTVTTVISNTHRIIPSGTVVGTNPTLNLKPLLTQNASYLVLQDFTTDRLHESEIILQNIDLISSFEMTVINTDTLVDTLTWANTGTGTLPEQIFKLNNHTNPISHITGINLPFSISYISMKFTSCGYIKNVCCYTDTVPNIVIKDGFENRDNVIDFQRQTVSSICTNQEENTVKTEHYNQTNVASDGTFRYIVNSVPSSFYVTPPSLIMMNTSQTTPYSILQSLLILFNRRIEVFLRDDSTLFTMSGSDGSTTLLRASFCTLLSSQISIPNSFLNLSPATTYTIHLARARLFQFEGHVPCLETSISFSTA